MKVSNLTPEDTNEQFADDDKNDFPENENNGCMVRLFGNTEIRGHQRPWKGK